MAPGGGEGLECQEKGDDRCDRGERGWQCFTLLCTQHQPDSKSCLWSVREPPDDRFLTVLAQEVR